MSDPSAADLGIQSATIIAGGVLATKLFDNRANRWRDTASGRFVPESQVVDEMRLHQQATFNVLENATKQLYSGAITVDQWQTVVAYELKDSHIAQSMFAVGGKNNMTAANYGRVGGTLKSEYGYLSQFAQDIADGKVSEARALSRIKQYGKATQQSYWREYDAATDGNYEIYWDLNPGDSCRASSGGYGCVEMSAASPYKVGELNAHPGDGGSTCHGNCNCTLRRERIN